MSHRFSLRFETTDRRGETIPITGQRFTIGRRPGNSLQILESSVSGKHAEILIEDAGALLRDLGSTNGCRVGAERVLEIRLHAGAEVHIGNVGLRFIDHEASAPPGAAETGVGAPGVPRGELPENFQSDVTMAHEVPEELRISAETFERARKSGSSSKLAIGVLAVVLIAGGGAGWYLTRPPGEGGASGAVPVVEPDGNLLSEDFSFEAEDSAWQSVEGVPGSFVRSRSARQRGDTGISAELAQGEYALHASRAVKVSTGRELVATGSLRAGDGAVARLGIEFGGAEGREPIRAWSDAVTSEDYTDVDCTAVVPEGATSARVLVLGAAPAGDGEAGGYAEADDVALTSGGSRGADHTLDDYKLYALDRHGLSLFKVGQPMLSSIHLRAKGATLGFGLAALAIEARPEGFRVTPGGDGAVTELALRVEADGVATIGGDGYSNHSVDFERADVTDLLLGRGYDLVRVRFDAPVAVRGRRVGEAFELGAGPVGAPFLLQLRFDQEREEAGKLAAAAQGAERAGRLGECLGLWRELLDRYPYEERLTSEANTTRARLLRVGRDEVAEVEREVERARFFRLVDLYRQCLDATQVVADRYAGSEIAAQANELAASVRDELATLEVDLDRAEVERLGAVLHVLEARQAEGLAGEVRTYLSESYGIDPATMERNGGR